MHPTRFLNSTGRAASLAVGVALMALTACQPYRFRGTEYVDPQPAPDFTLTRADGAAFHLADQRGRLVVIFFGFTSCPDVCPTTLSDARRVLEGLGERSDEIRYVFITVDPERDTPEALGSYVAAFDPAIIGLTGSPEALRQVWQSYGIFVEKVPADDPSHGYDVTHTARILVVDADGRLRLTYSFGTPYEDILQDLRHLLSA